MDKLNQGLEQFEIILTDEQSEAFRIYAKKIATVPHNLTTIRDPEGIMVQHFLDSLVILKYFGMDYNKKFCDVGAGAGLPLLPLKIVRPEMDATFIDSRQKSVNFLNDVIRSLGLKNCRAVHAHTTQMKEEKERKKFNYVLTRALGSVSYILENCLFLLKSGGEIFMYKGPKHEKELRAVPEKFMGKITDSEVREVRVPFLDRKRFIIRMKKI